MIFGTKKIKVSGYLPYSQLKAIPWVKPEKNQEYWGVPYSYDADNSSPYIQVIQDGKIVQTINALFILSIAFVSE
jgi:hypothetical protein